MAVSTLYGMALSPADVAGVLGRAKVRYVLVGAHAINLYTGRPRATQDVDVVTDAPAKARKAIESAYPHLTVEDHPVVIRFKDGPDEVLDLIKARSAKVFRRVLGLVTEVRISGQRVVVPTAEGALALKFASMTTPARATDDRMQDAVDFSRVAKLQEGLDETLLHELGELIYAGGGAALMKAVADSRAGRRLDI
jgi:hypothetical protein